MDNKILFLQYYKIMAEIFKQDYPMSEKLDRMETSEWMLEIMCAPFELIEKIKGKIAGILERIQQPSVAIVAETDKDFKLKLGDEDRGMCEMDKESEKPSLPSEFVSLFFKFWKRIGEEIRIFIS